MHAHVADELLRGGNLIGQSALKELRDVYGIDSTGCDNCWQQCDIKRSKALIDSTGIHIINTLSYAHTLSLTHTHTHIHSCRERKGKGKSKARAEHQW